MEAREILKKFKEGEISLEDAEHYFRKQPFEEMDCAKLDTHREIRSGFPEVIYCSGKADSHFVRIFRRLYEEHGEVLGTRATAHQYELVKDISPDVVYDEISHILKIEKKNKKRIGKIAVCTAGTADIPVAEEAAQVAEYFGSNVERIFDVGVSGIHRLFSRLEVIQEANCIVAVAGMEGALASVLGGLVDKPVIAVPTSVGYGASLNGLSALMTMINSCANGIAVVNIDNGYGAGYIATQINRMGCHAQTDAEHPAEKKSFEEKTAYACESRPCTMTLRKDDIPTEAQNPEKADKIIRLETNVDDCTGEVLGYVMERLLDAGARDVSYTPVFMKKNRPAYQLNVICTPDDVQKMEEIIFRETTTIGIRRIAMERTILPRSSKKIETSAGEAWVKECTLPDGETRCYPEYSSAAALAEAEGISLSEAYEMIRKAEKKQ